MDIREKIINLWVKNGEEPPYVYEIDAILQAVREALPKGYKYKNNKKGQYLDFIGSTGSGDTMFRFGYNQALQDMKGILK